MKLLLVLFASGVVLMAAGVLLRPKRVGVGWSLDIGFGDEATHVEKALFLVGSALALAALALYVF